MTLAMAVARYVYGLERLTWTTYGEKMSPPLYECGPTEMSARVWPGAGAVWLVIWNSPFVAGTKTAPSPALCHWPNSIVTSAWPSWSAIRRS